MSNYRRLKVSGGMFFFTVTLADRASTLLTDRVDRLRNVYRAVAARYPFDTVAICILPDHLHAIWQLPEDDRDFSMRWNFIKGNFSRGVSPSRDPTQSKIARREKGIWQRRFWEHTIRDEIDLVRHIDYIHFNPVKHGYVACVCDWPHSSFHRFVARGDLPRDWGGDMREITGTFGE